MLHFGGDLFTNGLGQLTLMQIGERHHEAQDIAKVDEYPPPPRVDALATILCLDSSHSMEGQAFDDMQRIAHAFIDGLEKVAEDYGLEENVAVVSLSDRARVVQHLTNDYSRVRDAIDSLHPKGRTPVFEALLVALAALERKGGVLNIAGVHKVGPRVLFITDGKVTSEAYTSGPDTPSPMDEAKLPVVKLVTDLGESKRPQIPKPIIWIPVGPSPDKGFLEFLSSLGHGCMASERQIPQLCCYHRKQVGVGNVYACVRQQQDDSLHGEDMINVVARALLSDLTEDDKNEVIDKVKQLLSSKTIRRKYDDFDYVFEDKKLAPIGSRVIRGPDWKWGNQDTEGVGTVINHDESDPDWVCVKWDNGISDRYRYGAGGAYDVLIVDGLPREPVSEDRLDIGVRVTRVPGWQSRDAHGARGGSGTVFRRNSRGEVQVRWDTGEKETHKYGCDGIYELQVCDTKAVSSSDQGEGGGAGGLEFTEEYSADGKDRRLSTTNASPQEQKPNVVWEWEDDNGAWHLYPENVQTKINREFGRRPEGTCLIQRDGKSVRVYFQAKKEKSLEDNTHHRVQFKHVDDAELEALRLEQMTTT